ncbi:MAG TPA: c-type cytochrome [Casimicrobiaceae bacterium]|nr:c-type cytochrome [Casimicrobiaceae bacterium]
MSKRWVLVAACAVLGASGARADEPAAKPDLGKAKQIVSTVCVACHGTDGNSASSANPNLAGQGAAYIALQLAHFKDGTRSNAVMAGMAASLTPEDMRSLGAYFNQQKPKGLGAKDPSLVSAGQKLYRGGNSATGVPACAACHSPTGVGIPARYPRLSGQYSDYVLAQLQAFKSGQRGMDKAGKDVDGRVMTQIAARMSDPEMRAVADYVAGLH